MKAISRLLGGVLLAALLGWAIASMSNAPFEGLVDPIGIGFIVAFVVAGTLMSFGVRLPLRALSAGLAGRRIDCPATLGLYLTVLTRGYVLSWVAGLCGIVLFYFAIMSHVDDPSSIGASIALAAMNVFWALLLAECVFAPARHALIAASPDTFQQTRNTSTSLAGAAVAFMVASIFFLATTNINFVLAFTGRTDEVTKEPVAHTFSEGPQGPASSGDQF